jgi:hypothetical protein
MLEPPSPHNAAPPITQAPEHARLLPDFTRRIPAAARMIRDRSLWALVIVALIVNLGLFAYLIIEFNRVPPTLPPLVPLHFDAAGEPDRIEPRSALFSLPQIGLIVIVGNMALSALMYRREPLAVYLLAGTAVVIQLLLWLAAIQIVRIVAL